MNMITKLVCYLLTIFSFEMTSPNAIPLSPDFRWAIGRNMSLGQKKLIDVAVGIFQNQTISTSEFAATHSRQDYRLVESEMAELQYIAISYLHCLMTGDSLKCAILNKVADTFPSFDSLNVEVWLKENFQFNNETLKEALMSTVEMQKCVKFPSGFIKVLKRLLPEEVVHRRDEPTNDLPKRFDDRRWAAADYQVKTRFKRDTKKEASCDVCVCPGISLDKDSSNANSKDKLVKLAEAMRQGNRTALRNQVAEGTSVNWVIDDGDRLLHIAAYKGALISSRTLLHLGAEVDTKDSTGVRPVVLTIDSGSQEVLHLLKVKGADVFEKWGYENKSLLHQAVLKGKRELVDLLIEEGISVNVVDGDGNTPIHKAVEMGNEAMIDQLLGKGADTDITDNNGESIRDKAFKNNNTALQSMIEDSDIPHPTGTEKNRTVVIVDIQNRLIEAIRIDDPAAIGEARESGASVNMFLDEGLRSLHLAAKLGSMRAARALIQLGAEIDGHDGKMRTPAVYAIDYHHLEILKLLKAKGSDFTQSWGTDKRTLLHETALEGEMNILSWLLITGFPIHTVDGDNATALHWAAYNNKLHLIEGLLNLGADINLKDKFQRSVLHWSVSQNFYQATELLLTRGSYIESRDEHGRTPLHSAAAKGAYRVIRLLLMKGADLFAKDKYTRTSLAIARVFCTAGVDTVKAIQVLEDEYKSRGLEVPPNPEKCPA